MQKHTMLKANYVKQTMLRPAVTLDLFVDGCKIELYRCCSGYTIAASCGMVFVFYQLKVSLSYVPLGT